MQRLRVRKGEKDAKGKKIQKGKVDIYIYIDGQIDAQIDRCKYIVRNREKDVKIGRGAERENEKERV